MAKVTARWAVVRHSGYAGGADPTWEQALEVAMARTKAEQDLVTKAGGLLFDEWVDADDFCEKAMYPGDDPGDEFHLVPRAQGTFSEKRLGALEVYVPVREAVG